jgi:hypothetical protein
MRHRRVDAPERRSVVIVEQETALGRVADGTTVDGMDGERKQTEEGGQNLPGSMAKGRSRRNAMQQ